MTQKEEMMATRKRKPRVIHIHGRRWFERTNGNTYHTCDIWVDGEHVHKIPFQYGYGSQYEWSAAEWLENNGYMPGRSHHANGGGDSLCRYCDEHGIKCVTEVDDVPRKKDL